MRMRRRTGCRGPRPRSGQVGLQHEGQEVAKLGPRRNSRWSLQVRDPNMKAKKWPKSGQVGAEKGFKMESPS